MSDIESLLAAFDTGSLLRPSPEIPNLVDLSRALASLAGAEGIESTLGSAGLAELIGPSDHLVFVLADGLGMNLVEAQVEDAFLSRHRVAELRSVFPSASAVALTSIATGEWPSRHAVTGWWTHLPEVGSAAALLPFVTRSDRRSLADLGVTAEQAFPVPSIMRRIPRDTLALFPSKIAESVYSTYFSGGRPKLGYGALREAIDIILARIGAAARPTFTYLYTLRIDREAHRHGSRRPEVQSAVSELDREVQRLASGLGDRGRVVVTGDHGFLDAPRAARHRIRPSDELLNSLRFPPSGDTRVLYFHVRDGAEARFLQRFRERFAGRFLLVSVDEAESLRLFGPSPLSSQARSRLGDWIAISSGADVIAYTPTDAAGWVLHEPSHHSGLSPEEMRVPLVVAPRGSGAQS